VRPDTTDNRITTHIDDKIHFDVAITQIRIERGNYDSPQALAYILADTYNVLIDQLVDCPHLNAHMYVELVDGKIAFVNNDTRVRHMMVMDDYRLATALGLKTSQLDANELDAKPLFKAELRGTSDPWLAAYVPNMFLYCDIVTDQYVGDVMAPLLDLVPVKRAAIGERVQYSLIPPTYLEVARKFIDTIHMEIRDDKGAPVPFDDSKGCVVVRLHFRRKGATPSFVM
jgi:hypothetical protein